MFKRVASAGLEGLSLSFIGELNNDKFDHFLNKIIKEVKDENLKLYAWTINHPKLANRLKSAGFSGILTDKFGLLKAMGQ